MITAPDAHRPGWLEVMIDYFALPNVFLLDKDIDPIKQKMWQIYEEQFQKLNLRENVILSGAKNLVFTMS
jgi:hypothetical protein